MAAIAYDPYEDEDYYTLTNPAFAGDRFAPYSEGAIAFDAPGAGGVRYPIATPATGGQVGTLGAPTADWDRVIGEMVERDRPMQQRQYNMEVDRAVRNQVEDMNPSSIQDATRLRGLLMFQNFTRDGMDSAEASRRAAPWLYFNHPQATAMATREIPSVNMPTAISTVPLLRDGKPAGTAVLDREGNPHYVNWDTPPKPLPAPKDVVPPDVKQTQKNIQTEIDLAKKDVERLGAALEKAETPDDKSSIGRAALAARERLNELMNASVVASTNYPRPSVQMPTNIVQQALQTPTPAANEITATNRSTGEKIVLRNGKWQPLK